jgi:hypothetical protein
MRRRAAFTRFRITLLVALLLLVLVVESSGLFVLTDARTPFS